MPELAVVGWAWVDGEEWGPVGLVGEARGAVVCSAPLPRRWEG